MTSAREDRREGRGQLSSIDMLPEECEPDLIWAIEELRERRMPGNEILKEFNARLADRGIKGISKSAWNRYSVRKALQFRKLEQGHAIMAGIHKELASDAPDQVTMVLGEMLKLQVFQILEGGDLGTKDLAALARVLRNAVQAQSDTVDVRKGEAELQDRLKQATEAVTKAGAKAGLSPEAVEEINKRIAGIA